MLKYRNFNVVANLGWIILNRAKIISTMTLMFFIMIFPQKSGHNEELVVV